jgi:hypothetical protein
MKLAALALLTTLGLGGVAGADPVRPVDRPRGELRQLLLERFDKNHDGQLDPKERRHAIRAIRRIAHRMAVQERREARRANREAGRDANRDANREAGRDADREARRADREAGRDANREAGRDADREARRADREARRQARMRALVQRYDRNGDGVVTPDEMPPGVARRLQPLDRNRDGWLDDRDQH